MCRTSSYDKRSTWQLYLRRGLPEPGYPTGSRWESESVCFLKWRLWPKGWKRWQWSRPSCPERRSHSHVCASGRWCSCRSSHRKIWRCGWGSIPQCRQSVCPCWDVWWMWDQRRVEEDGEERGDADRKQRERSKAPFRLALSGGMEIGMPSAGQRRTGGIRSLRPSLDSGSTCLQSVEKWSISLRQQTQPLCMTSFQNQCARPEQWSKFIELPTLWISYQPKYSNFRYINCMNLNYLNG